MFTLQCKWKVNMWLAVSTFICAPACEKWANLGMTLQSASIVHQYNMPQCTSRALCKRTLFCCSSVLIFTVFHDFNTLLHGFSGPYQAHNARKYQCRHPTWTESVGDTRSYGLEHEQGVSMSSRKLLQSSLRVRFHKENSALGPKERPPLEQTRF